MAYLLTKIFPGRHTLTIISNLTDFDMNISFQALYEPQDIQKKFYQSCILPLFDYGCNTWGTTSSVNVERLSKLQKRAMRIILQAE